MTARSTTFQLTVRAPVTGVPEWVNQIGTNQWAEIANGTGDTYFGGNKLSAPGIYYPEVAAPIGGTWGLTNDYVGCAYDYDRQEIVYLLNGGHSGRAGNEGYALALHDDTPYWYRLNDPTPFANLGEQCQTNAGGVDAVLTYSDVVTGNSVLNRPRSLHTYGMPTYKPASLDLSASPKDRIWFPFQPFSWLQQETNSAVCSFDRTYSFGGAPGQFLPANGSETPLAWAADLGPWTHHGKFSTGGVYITGFTCGLASLNTDNGEIWCVGNQQQNSKPVWKVNAAGLGSYIHNPSLGTSYMQWWCYDSYHAVYLLGLTNGAVWSMNPATSPPIWTQRTAAASGAPSVTEANRIGSGSFWRNPTTGECGVYYMHPHVLGSRLFKLSVPDDLASGVWQWSELTSAPQSGLFLDAAVGTYNRARVITFPADPSVAVMFYHGSDDGLTGTGGYNKPVHVFRIQ